MLTNYPPVHLDFETGSPVDLKKTGVYVYAEDVRTRVWGFSYSWGDGNVYRWEWGDPDPELLLWHIGNGLKFTAHNVGFERTIWNYIMRRYRPHWPELRIEQLDCTMARAAALALPLGLDKLGEVLNAREQKDAIGSALMKKMAKPRKVHADGSMTWWDDAINLQRLALYRDQDVRSEIEIDGLVSPLSEHERKVWQLDQVINDRGLQIDLNAAARAAELVDYAQRLADKEMAQITGGYVKKVTDRNGMLSFMNSRGIECEKINKGNTDELLAMTGFHADDVAKAALELRNSAGKTSVAKYAKMMEAACEDGRIRGTLQYHGATTGRWAGRLIQPQNFPRTDPDNDIPKITYVKSLLKSSFIPIKDVYDLIQIGVGDPIPWLSKSLRSMIIAGPGKKLVSGDFSNIEGRANAYLAGEEWKLTAFREYDAGVGADLYKLAYARAFGVDVSEVDKIMRQLGKVMELALGYQGGVGAFISMGAVYGLKPSMLVQPIMMAASAEEWDDMAKRYASASDKFGLPEDQWTAIKIIIKRWRAAHPNIMQGWWDLSDAAIAAIEMPNTYQYAYNGRVCYTFIDGWLYCQLPSTRVLCYPAAEVRTKKVTRVNRDGEEYETWQSNVYYKAFFEGRWQECYMYGGLQCENVVSAFCRCLLDRAMLRVEEAGYPLIVTVHDELVSEVPEGFGSAEEYRRLMSQGEPWAPGFPIASATWEDKEYIK